jgi:hypothetical protein
MIKLYDILNIKFNLTGHLVIQKNKTYIFFIIMKKM